MNRTSSRCLHLLAVLGLAAGCAPGAGDEPVSELALALGDHPTVELLASVVQRDAIALTLTNVETQPVYCKTVAFRAPIQRLDHCGEPPLSNEAIALGPLAFAGSEQKRWSATPEANAGGLLGAEHIAAVAAERKRQGFGDEVLEYCPMGATERVLDCGYYCDGTHPYGEDWKVTNAEGGYHRYRCPASGVSEHYDTKCAGEIQVGGTRRDPGGEGYTLLRTCQADATFLTTAECSAGYQQTPDRQACEPASCGATPHGGELFVADVEHGKLFAVCKFGQSDPNTLHAVCDRDFVPNAGNNGCVPRPMRDCGPGKPHGWTTTYHDCCPGECRVTETCHDGAIRKTREILFRVCR